MVVAIDWDPNEPHCVYAGTDRGVILRSRDRGVSWEILSVRLPTVAVGALVVGPVAERSIWHKRALALAVGDVRITHVQKLKAPEMRFIVHGPP